VKRTAVIALTALLLTGCASQPSEEWLQVKHWCIDDTSYAMEQGETKIKTHEELDRVCSARADKYEGLSRDEIFELAKMEADE
jgi:uncharacterized protein YcfL